MMRRIGLIVGLAGCLAVMAIPAHADWVPMGNSLNASSGNFGRKPSAVAQGSSVYVAYEDYQPSSSYQVVVKRWNGANWSAVGGVVNNDPYEYAQEPQLAIASNGTPYIIWEETPGYLVYANRWNGTDWETLGGTLNADLSAYGGQPVIAVDRQDSTLAYAVWIENYTHLCYKRWHEGAVDWVEGNTLNAVIGQSVQDPAIALDSNNRPVVAWCESNTTDGYYDIRVKRLTTPPDIWTPMESGLSLPSYPNGTQPKLIYDSGAGLYLAFTAFNGSASGWYLRVFRWNGSAWDPVGGLVSTESTVIDSPSLAIANNRPTLFYLQSLGSGPYQTVVKEWNAGAWNWVGTSFNRDAAKNARKTALTVLNNVPYTVWEEQLTDGPVTGNVYASQWVDLTPPTPTATATMVPGSLLPGESISAYPMPAATQVTFALNTQENGPVVIKVYNTRFRLVKELTGTSVSGRALVQWDVSGISPGIYFYHLTINGRKFSARKLVVAR